MLKTLFAVVNCTFNDFTGIICLLLHQDDESNATCSVNNDVVPAEVDERQNHMKPVVVLETLNLARLVIMLGSFGDFVRGGTCC